jgi:hypothetical protein
MKKSKPRSTRAARSRRVVRPVRAASRSTRKTAPGGGVGVDHPLRIDRSQRMLEVGGHLVSYFMFLSHRLRPLTGEPEMSAGPPNSPDRLNAQFGEVRRSLLMVVSHHPVLKGKLERAETETARLLDEAGRHALNHPTRVAVQQEAKLLSQRFREHSRAMSDLVAVLRNV